MYPSTVIALSIGANHYIIHKQITNLSLTMTEGFSQATVAYRVMKEILDGIRDDDTGIRKNCGGGKKGGVQEIGEHFASTLLR